MKKLIIIKLKGDIYVLRKLLINSFFINGKKNILAGVLRLEILLRCHYL